MIIFEIDAEKVRERERERKMRFQYKKKNIYSVESEGRNCYLHYREGEEVKNGVK